VIEKISKAKENRRLQKPRTDKGQRTPTLTAIIDWQNTPMMSNNDTEDQKIEHASIQAAKFSKAKPLVWFQLEAQFVCKGITKDNLKYCHALQALDVVAEVSDFITNPPQYGKYEAFKARILHIFQDSEEKRLKTLLYQAELGDQRVS